MNISNKRLFFILGGPATGRNTLCKKYAQENGWDHLSISSQLKDEIEMLII